MATVGALSDPSQRGGREVALRSVTAIMGMVVGLTFLFGFGNVWILALHLGVPAYVAPLVAPAVDLSILGLLLGIRDLALNGAGSDRLRPARRLLIFASVVTLALNVAEPMIAGNYGKAAFDAVGPLLLIGWAEVGPGLIMAMGEVEGGSAKRTVEQRPVTQCGEASTAGVGDEEAATSEISPMPKQRVAGCRSGGATTGRGLPDDGLLDRARLEDARHWELFRRPISAEALRKRLHVGAAMSRTLVAQLRRESHGRISVGSGSVANVAVERDETSSVVPVRG